MWDAALSDGFESALPPQLAHSFGEVAAAVVLYSQADRASLAEARRWLRAARSLVLAAAAEAEPSVVLVLVGMGPPAAAEAEAVADLRHRLLEVEAEAEAMAEEEGAHHMVAHGVGAESAGHTLMLDLAEHLLGRAVARREAEQAREKSLNDLDVTLHPEGLFVPVDPDRLSCVLNAARLVDVGTEALQEAQEKLDALTAPKWWDRLGCTSRRAASPGPGAMPGAFDGD